MLLRLCHARHAVLFLPAKPQLFPLCRATKPAILGGARGHALDYAWAENSLFCGIALRCQLRALASLSPLLINAEIL